MERGSRRFQLIVAWIVFIILALQLAINGLGLLLEHSAKRRIAAELGIDLHKIAKGLVIDQSGNLVLAGPPADPQFGKPYSGRYWQVSTAGRAVLRSPSLWDYTFADVPRPPPGETDVVQIDGPDEQHLIAVAKTIEVPDAGKSMPLQVMIAIANSGFLNDAKTFVFELVVALAGLAAALLLAAWLHVSAGLRPLRALRLQVAAVRAGIEPRITGAFPKELEPLVQETNAIIDARSEELKSAKEHATNLAREMKSFLVMLDFQSRDLPLLDKRPDGGKFRQQKERMRLLVERQLVELRAREAGAIENARSDVREMIRDIVGALQLLPRGREVKWQIELPTVLLVAAERGEINDILVNLIDNAMKWARERMLVIGRVEGGEVLISVEDDGPGMAIGDISRLLGTDELAMMEKPEEPGSGSGLTIVRDLVKLLGGRLELGRSDMGGLRALIALPAGRSA